MFNGINDLRVIVGACKLLIPKDRVRKLLIPKDRPRGEGVPHFSRPMLDPSEYPPRVSDLKTNDLQDSRRQILLSKEVTLCITFKGLSWDSY
jgi:hypothetical protein